MPATFPATGDPVNYVIGGVRLWYAKLMSPGVWDTWTDLGNIVTGDIRTEHQPLELYNALVGDVLADPSTMKLTKVTIPFTFDEMSEDLLSKYLGAGTITSHAWDLAVNPYLRGKFTVRNVSNVGPESEIRFPDAVMYGQAGLAYGSDDWVKGNFLINVIPTTGSSPWGQFINKGVGANLAAAAAPSW